MVDSLFQLVAGDAGIYSGGRCTLVARYDHLGIARRFARRHHEGRRETRYPDDGAAGLSAGIARGSPYLTKNDGAIILGRYPYVTEYVADFKVLSLEFLDPSSSAYTLRPADPLDVKFGFYSPSSSFAYPGGQEPI